MITEIRRRLAALAATSWKERAALLKGIFGPLGFAAASALILLARIPYGFETNDQFQYLLLPYREIYTPFLTGDWFTWHTSHYHLSFSVFIRLLHWAFGESGFPVAVFTAHVLVLATLGYSLLRSARAAQLHWTAALFALLTVAFVRIHGVGGAILNHGVLLPADMALPFLMLGFAMWIEKSPIKAGIFLGLSGLIHANFAVLGPLVIAAPELYRLYKERTLAPTLKLTGGFAALAWPSLISAAMGFFTSDTAPEALNILFDIRSPHHYRPPLFDSPELLWPAALLLLSIPTWLECRRRGNGRAIAVLFALIGTLAVGVLAVEVLDNRLIIRLFLWRMSVPLILFAALGVGESLARAVRRPVSWAPVAAVLSIVTVLCFTEGGPVFAPNRRLDISRISASMTKVGFPDATRVRGIHRASALYSWIQKHTPEDALFLVPPGMDDFRLQARRGIFVDWKCCPMKGEEIAEWARRMNAVMGTKTMPAAGYALHRVAMNRYTHRSLDALAALARREGLGYIIAKRVPKTPSDLEKLISKSGWAVYRVR